MIGLHIILDGEGAWKDLFDKQVREATDIHIAALPNGMASGKPSVAFRLDLSDGSVAIGQTSLALLLTAADALRLRYGDPREQ
jgi:hypothetical protein